MSKFFKLNKTPSGKELFAYTSAILEVTNMINGDEYPLKKFLKNFSTHLDAGRIIQSSNGYRLTACGIDYFKDRLNPNNPQHVTRGEVERMIRAYPVVTQTHYR